MSEKMVRVMISMDEEAFPVLIINKADAGDAGREIPEKLFRRLRMAEQYVADAEQAIMEYVGTRHPEDRDVQKWLED